MLNIEKLPVVWFHGTTSDSIIPLSKKQINIVEGRKFTDFWQGFYLTSSYEQAKKMSEERAKKKQAKNGLEKRPAVLAYKLDLNFLDSLSDGKRFSTHDASWAGFVYNNRKGIACSTHVGQFQVYTFDDHNTDLRYQYVYGPVADGNPNFTTALYELEVKGSSFDRFVNGIKPRGILIDQLSFHNNLAANKALHYIGEVMSDVHAKEICSRYPYLSQSR
ncbi:hypothetical protein CBW65_10440 [Tumebacillus avium]|uniref:DUF3990 domain-containing protein n=1 Tax=Tumebacillus avium TaxID=1903704 RepID=A0A1Y0ILH4_9BACL|nr:DUF3990 domain-containing protein [Tumebacillus avium]ARU61371.1 hypothetical protein CBW65_10440 [Tumebacillus avium]